MYKERNLQNEIRDFAENAPPKWKFNGVFMINLSKVRSQWLAEIDSGTIHERINRRSGYKYPVPPFYAPWRGVRASIQRHRRNQFRKEGLRWEYKHLSRATH